MPYVASSESKERNAAPRRNVYEWTQVTKKGGNEKTVDRDPGKDIKYHATLT